jgi:hypothetical protein
MGCTRRFIGNQGFPFLRRSHSFEKLCRRLISLANAGTNSLGISLRLCFAAVTVLAKQRAQPKLQLLTTHTSWRSVMEGHH